MAFCLESDGVA